MTRSRLRNTLLALAVVLLMSFLFLKTQAIDFEQHSSYVASLRRLKELDATLNQNILGARYGLLLSYDPLVANLAEINAISNDLHNIPSFVDETARAEIGRAVEDYIRLARQKEALVEQFKSQNAVLKNSLYYLPVLIGRYAREVETGSREERLAGTLNELLQNVLVYNLTFNPELVPVINGQVRVLEGQAAFPLAGRGIDLEMVAAHVDTILRTNSGVDSLIQELVGFPTSSQANTIYEVYNRHYEAALQRTNIYRLVLYVLAVFLLGSVAHVFIRLRNATVALNIANESLERRVRERTEELALARDAALAATRAKSSFLANMSHELRTPLHAIIGFSELLHEQTLETLSRKQQKYLDSILTSGRHLLQLIGDILDLSKIEVERLELDPAPFPVDEALLDVVATVKPLAVKKSLGLSVDIAPGLPLLNADQLRFTQIMYNLLSNAIKFTPEGGRIAITAAAAPPSSAWESKSAPAGWLQIAVSDTGLGIKPGEQDRIFDEFEQGDSSYNRTQPGTGLGLALTRKLIELHGGRIWVESEGVEGKGSTFTFVLPLDLEVRSGRYSLSRVGSR